MSKYFYNPKDLEYFLIISREHEKIDVQANNGKKVSLKSIDNDLFNRRCFSVKKMPSNKLLNGLTYQLTLDTEITPVTGNLSIENKENCAISINSENLDRDKFIMSFVDEKTKRLDIISTLNFKNKIELINYISKNEIMTQQSLSAIQDFKFSKNEMVKKSGLNKKNKKSHFRKN